MKIGKAEAEEMLQQIWNSKQTFDAQNGGRSEMFSFVHHYFKTRFVTDAATREWHYSFLACLDRYSHDADFRLFRAILLCKMPEDVYWDEVELLARLKNFMGQVDEAFNGKSRSGLVPRQLLQQSLAELWPNKSDEQLERLGVALRKDMGSATFVQVNSLWDQTDDGLQTNFIEEVRRQYLQELQHYRDEVYSSIRDLETIENQGNVNAWQVKEKIQKVDPAKPVYEVIHLIQDMFGEPMLAYEEMMAYADAIQDDSPATEAEIEARINEIDEAMRSCPEQHVEILIERLDHLMLRSSTMRMPSAEDEKKDNDAADRLLVDQNGVSTAQMLATMLLLR
jgi:hypothetical protein